LLAHVLAEGTSSVSEDLKMLSRDCHSKEGTALELGELAESWETPSERSRVILGLSSFRILIKKNLWI
jgi:hypothetical protein